MTISFATALRTARAQAVLDALNAGSGPAKFRVYGDTRPASANVAVTTETLLLEFVLNDPAGAVATGVLTIDVDPVVTDDALATEQATWGRFLDSDNNVVMDVSEGTDFTLTDDTLETGQTANILSFTMTEAAS